MFIFKDSLNIIEFQCLPFYLLSITISSSSVDTISMVWYVVCFILNMYAFHIQNVFVFIVNIDTLTECIEFTSSNHSILAWNEKDKKGERESSFEAETNNHLVHINSLRWKNQVIPWHEYMNEENIHKTYVPYNLHKMHGTSIHFWKFWNNRKAATNKNIRIFHFDFHLIREQKQRKKRERESKR